MKKTKAILTFDLEFWYNSGFLKKYFSEEKEQIPDNIEELTMELLKMLNKHNQRATFFILGQLAEKYPDIIKKISELGHEIASHGYSHKTLWELDAESFKKEIELSKKIINDIIGKEPKGFRAPNFSLNKKTKWGLEVLKINFKYDSSIHPLKPFRKLNEHLEVPPSLGGIYFRIIPLWLYSFLIKYFYRIPVLYFHISDIFESSPKIENAPWLKRKIKYWGMKKALKKFEKLLKKFNCVSVEQYLDEDSTN